MPAKRNIGTIKRTHSHKTKKRLEIKRAMLAARKHSKQKKKRKKV